jgi:hypothetical protein
MAPLRAAAFGIEDATGVAPKTPADNPAVVLFETGGAAGSTDDAPTLSAAILLNNEGAGGAWVDPGDEAGFIFWVTCGAPMRAAAVGAEEAVEAEAGLWTPADDPAVLSLVAGGAAGSTDDGCSAAGA